MPYVRKDAAGSDSLGHSWPEDGAVVEMPHEEAVELLDIPDGGFSLADGPSHPEPAAAEVAPDPEQAVTEPGPVDDNPVTEEEPAKPAARRGRKPATEA